MIRNLAAFTVISMLVACNANVPDENTTADQAAPASAMEQSGSTSGVEAYEQSCAGCHDEGADGAPRTGDPEAWVGRSSLWEAVLFEHAKKGYLEMPAKGGDAGLADSTVAKAAEYMLTITFPGTRRD
jgi:cytochrome c5